MTSKRERENYFMMDHRHSDPVPTDLLLKAGLPAAAGRGLFEMPAFTCNHCQRQVIMDPARTSDPPYCRGCDSYLCKNCAAIRSATLECKPFSRIIDEVLTAAEQRR